MKRAFLFLSVFLIGFYSLAQEEILAPVVMIGEANMDGFGVATLIGQKSGKLFFLTSAHVTTSYNGEDFIPIKFWNGARTKAKLEMEHIDLDVSIVSCVAPSSYPVPNSFAVSLDPIEKNQRVITISHPYGNTNKINRKARIEQTEETDFDGRYFYISQEEIWPGSSGGVVLNQKYKLLGMMTSVSKMGVKVASSSLLMKVIREWNGPFNLLLGITISDSNQELLEMYYTLAFREGNVSFKKGEWENALESYERAFRYKATPEIQQKIAMCESELEKDRRYQEIFEKGKKTVMDDPEQALADFLEAQKYRNTVDVQRWVLEMEKIVPPRSDTIVGISVGGGGIMHLPIPDLPHINLASILLDFPECYFIQIQGGEFMMGEDATQSDGANDPKHLVQLDDFWLGQTEVTQELWVKIMYTNPSRFIGGRLPVENISWEDCKEFIRRLNLLVKNKNIRFRLPTEAEWEYAAGGGANGKNFRRTKFAGTDFVKELNKYGNFCDVNCLNANANHGYNDKFTKTAPVGSLEPNHLGLHDMTGNVWEWCEDFFEAAYYYQCKHYHIVLNPKGPEDGETHVLRGGSWASELSLLGVTARAEYWPLTLNGESVGLRLVMEYMD